uniref:Uncharacterized protein At2g18610 n=1 Tax=Arabidopsis thaliana TaxID=3702 RepID=Q9ZU76_ARATH|nr:hypothetical protein [Arabidopsis thaliana]
MSFVLWLVGKKCIVDVGTNGKNSWKVGGKDGVACRDHSGFRLEKLGLFCWWKLQKDGCGQKLNRRKDHRAFPLPSVVNERPRKLND